MLLKTCIQFKNLLQLLLKYVIHTHTQKHTHIKKVQFDDFFYELNVPM